jgi:mannose-6-phosphate isomerase-like protein (cupin superfamily)
MSVTPNPVLAASPFPGILHATLAGSELGLKQLSIWQQILAPGAATPPHRHDCEEVVLCSAGRGELRFVNPEGIDGKFSFGAHQTVCIPRNALHQLVNSGRVPLHLVAVFSKTPVEVYLPDGEPVTLPWSS